ncbi:hypothetical protein [Thermoflavifilum aggregans]|nr:hypothetical protein [Thermoflavifilum aggregans]MBX6380749.1 hypothetical protein [Thermoflavifilum aggregans]
MMIRLIVIVVLAGLLFTACSKNHGFPSTPQITLESVNPLELGNGETLQIVLDFKDAEGDIQDSVFVREDVGYDYYDIFYPMPGDIPKQRNMQGQIILSLPYGSGAGGFAVAAPRRPNLPDTAIFYIYIKDLQGHISDTVKTPPVIVQP